jgi:uncharacterized membrane protein
MLFQTTFNHSKSYYAKPHDSAYGMPLWTYILAVGILLFIVVKVWIAVKKDKKA